MPPATGGRRRTRPSSPADGSTSSRGASTPGCTPAVHRRRVRDRRSDGRRAARPRTDRDLLRQRRCVGGLAAGRRPVPRGDGRRRARRLEGRALARHPADRRALADAGRRFDMCRSKGIDRRRGGRRRRLAQDSGFELTGDDQLRFNRMLAGLAHERSLHDRTQERPRPDRTSWSTSSTRGQRAVRAVPRVRRAGLVHRERARRCCTSSTSCEPAEFCPVTAPRGSARSASRSSDRAGRAVPRTGAPDDPPQYRLHPDAGQRQVA